MWSCTAVYVSRQSPGFQVSPLLILTLLLRLFRTCRTLHRFAFTAANFENPIKIAYPPDDDDVEATLDNHTPISTTLTAHLYPPYLLATDLHPLCLLTTFFQHHNIIIASDSTLDSLN